MPTKSKLSKTKRFTPSSNMMKLLKRHPHWKQTYSICQRLKKSGYTAWLAGGAVRDLVLKLKPSDFDIATDATPEQVMSLFKKVINVGKDFGAVKVVEQKVTIDVVSFRKDGLYIDGRRPETIEHSTPEEDAARRDFTMNALFLDPETGKIHDYVGGIQDIKKKIIRTVGEPGARFTEDKLRIFRALRFVSQLNFKIDTQTLGAIRRMAHEIHVVSGERIFEETTKLLKGKHFIKALELAVDTGVLKELFGIENIDFKRAKKIKPNADLILKWSFLFSHLGLVQRESSYQKMRCSHELRNSIEEILKISTHLKLFDNLKLSDQKHLAALEHIQQGMNLYSLGESLKSKHVQFIKKNKKLPKPLVGSQDLMRRGIAPGAFFGQLLKESYEAQLNDVIKSKKQAQNWLDLKVLSLRK